MGGYIPSPPSPGPFEAHFPYVVCKAEAMIIHHLTLLSLLAYIPSLFPTLLQWTANKRIAALHVAARGVGTPWGTRAVLNCAKFQIIPLSLSSIH